MSETIPLHHRTPSSHVALRWLSLRHGRAPEALRHDLTLFVTEMLRRFEQVESRTEQAREHRTLDQSDQSWLGIEKVESFLRELRDEWRITRYLGDGHHFVLAVLPARREGEKDQVVGVAQFKEEGKKKLVGQFTCVNPEMQRQRIGEKLHRAIQGFGRKYGYGIYEANLAAAASQKMYERMQCNPRVRVGKMPKQGITEKVIIKYPKKKNGIPSVKVRIFSLLRRRKR